MKFDYIIIVFFNFVEHLITDKFNKIRSGHCDYNYVWSDYNKIEAICDNPTTI